MAPQILQPGCRKGVTESKENDAAARHNHGNNRHHFDQRQPELHLAENAHAAQVHGADKKDNAQHPDPAGNIGIPQPHIDAERGNVREGDDHHLKGVGPAGNKTRQRAKILARVAAEGAGNGVAYRHFPQRPHHDKHRRAADQIGQQYRRARGLDRRCRAVEQPGTDGGAEGDKTNVPGIQPAQQVWLVLLLHMQVS